MTPITIHFGHHVYHPIPVGKDGLFEHERKALKRINKSLNTFKNELRAKRRGY